MKLLWFILAWISLALGTIGVFLPVLPTAPFVILSAFLFSKSSPRFHAWVLSLPYAGPAVEDWSKRRVIRTRAKVMCLSMITLSLVTIWWLAKIYIGVKIGVTVILLSVAAFVGTRKSR